MSSGGPLLLMVPVPSGLRRDGQHLCLTLSGDEADRVMSCSLSLLGRKVVNAATEIACQRTAAGFEAWVPLEWFRGDETHWDACLALILADGSTQKGQLLGYHQGEIPTRHFFKCVIEERGLSAYLSDSASSLVFYSAPLEQHACVTAGEDAKHSFARDLTELPLLNDLVFFESFLGKAYAGNPRYLYEELLKTRPDLRFVWAYNGSATIPGNPQIVRRGTAGYYRLLAQAKYRVNNIRFPVCGKKDETIYLQTWHGTPLKRLSFDIEVKGPEVDARDALYQESRAWSILLSENPYSSTVLPRAFRYQGQVLELGYPLTDALLDSSINKAARIRALGLPEGRRFILYAPTWRDDKSLAAWQHQFDLNLDLVALSSSLPGDCVLLIKAHHLVSEKLDRASLPANILDMSHIEDINDLCVLADVLVTDYSSVMFDFAVTGRPILFYCYDLEAYSTETRGLYLDMITELPGPVAETTEQLVQFICALDEVSMHYALRYTAFQERFCVLNDGKVSRRVVAAVFGRHHGD